MSLLTVAVLSLVPSFSAASRAPQEPDFRPAPPAAHLRERIRARVDADRNGAIEVEELAVLRARLREQREKLRQRVLELREDGERALPPRVGGARRGGLQAMRGRWRMRSNPDEDKSFRSERDARPEGWSRRMRAQNWLQGGRGRALHSPNPTRTDAGRKSAPNADSRPHCHCHCDHP